MIIITAGGADYNPLANDHLSDWSRDCYNGYLDEVKRHLVSQNAFNLFRTVVNMLP
jgi:hypothetical protein